MRIGDIREALARVEPRRWVEVIGLGIGITWLVVGILLLTGVVEAADTASLELGNPTGLLPIQLVTYSFLHNDALRLVFDLLWLIGLVNICKDSVTPAGFVRLYSLGAIGGGLVYLLLVYLFGDQPALTGGTVPLVTMLGALAVLQPRREVLVFGSMANRALKGTAKLVGSCMEELGCLVLIGLLWGASFLLGNRPILVGLSYYADLLVMAFFPIQLRWVAVAWSVARVAQFALLMYLGENDGRLILPTLFAGLIAGGLYAAAEIAWKRYQAHRKAAVV